MSYLVPTVIERSRDGERAYDIYSRLLKDRILFVTGEIDMGLANSVIAQLLFLQSQDDTKDIKLYVNSPGGHVESGLAIIDTMNHIKCEVSTICVGWAASMGAMILASGTKGKRFALANAEIMIHQPWGGVQGQASDIEITAKKILRTRQKLAEMLVEASGNSMEKIERDMDRDYWLTSEEAKSYGLIDKVIGKAPSKMKNK